jgi:hypothetical protein
VKEMKRAWMVAVAMAAGMRVDAGEAKPAADFRVSIYMDYEGGGDLRGANLSKAIAAKILRKIGVTLVWVDSKS